MSSAEIDGYLDRLDAAKRSTLRYPNAVTANRSIRGAPSSARVSGEGSAAPVGIMRVALWSSADKMLTTIGRGGNFMEVRHLIRAAPRGVMDETAHGAHDPRHAGYRRGHPDPHASHVARGRSQTLARTCPGPVGQRLVLSALVSTGDLPVGEDDL